MVIECEGPRDIEVIVGTYEEFVLGYKVLKTEDGKLNLSQTFATHSHRASVRSVAGGGKFLASGGADDSIQIYDMKLRKEMNVLMHHDKTVTCLAFINQTHLISGSDDGDLVLWRTGNWQCEKILTAHKEKGIAAIAVHPSGKLCLSAGRDHSLKTWNLVKGRPAYTTNLHAQAEDLAWSLSGDHYAVIKMLKGGAHFAVDIYAVEVAGVVYSFVPASRPACIYFIDDDVLAIGTDTGIIELHSVSGKSCISTIAAHTGRVRCIEGVKFESGEEWLVSASSKGEITIWKYIGKKKNRNTQHLEKLGTTNCGCRVTCMAAIKTPDGAIPSKVEKEEVVEEIKPVSVPVKSVPRTGRVIVELEDSSGEEEEEEIPKAEPKKRKQKSEKTVFKKQKVITEVKKKKNKKIAKK